MTVTASTAEQWTVTADTGANPDWACRPGPRATVTAFATRFEHWRGGAFRAPSSAAPSSLFRTVKDRAEMDQAESGDGAPRPARANMTPQNARAAGGARRARIRALGKTEMRLTAQRIVTAAHSWRRRRPTAPPRSRSSARRTRASSRSRGRPTRCARATTRSSGWRRRSGARGEGRRARRGCGGAHREERRAGPATRERWARGDGALEREGALLVAAQRGRAHAQGGRDAGGRHAREATALLARTASG